MFRNILRLLSNKRMAIILMLSIVTIIGIYAIYVSNLSYAVLFNGREIGITNNKDEIPLILESINNGLNNKTGKLIEISPELTYEEVWAIGKQEDSIETITMMAEKSIGLEAEAYLLNVNGKDLFYLYSEESANQIIETLKSDMIEKIQNSNIKEVSILEEVITIPVTTSPKDIINSDEALKLIVSGTEKIQSYTVQQGDTVSQIAVNFDVSSKDIKTANPELDINKLKIGQILNLSVPKPLISVKVVEEKEYIETIPFDVKYKETSNLYIGETKTSYSGSEGKKEIKAEVTYINGIISDKKVVEENIIQEPDSKIILKGSTARPKTLAYGAFKSPTRGSGRISSRFGPRWGSYHKGLDIANPTGTPIVAADGGKVAFSGWKGDYGYLVIINHENGYATYYGHASKLLVKKGDRVYRGQTIAKVGNTGRSTGPHLHFEVRKNGTPVDPLKYISY